MLKEIIENLKKRYRSFMAPIRLVVGYHQYIHGLPGLLRRVYSKERIKVVFLPINVGMWKCDGLYRLLQEHPRFDPSVLSFFVPVDSRDYQLRNQQHMREFFTGKGYLYHDMYDVSTGKWFDLKSYAPDIVFYTQAVDAAYPGYRIRDIWKDSVFYYIPYCLSMENEREDLNTLLYNICAKVFAPSEYHKKEWMSFFLNKGRNIVVTGYPSFDYLTGDRNPDSGPWNGDNGFKRIIWAPHHSITKDDLFDYSNFLLIADDMLRLAKKYKDTIQFAFKPHPRLRPKLESDDVWGAERTGEYYRAWAEMDNTVFVDGEYYDLFMTSDAMIHDCSTFLAEYLLTQKPVFFVSKKGYSPDLNDYGRQCMEQHYSGSTIDDIEAFIRDVVLEGNDPRRDGRMAFINSKLKVGNGSVAQRIFNEILKDMRDYGVS